MNITTLQLETLRQLLDYFIKEAKVENNQLVSVYSFVFFDHSDLPETVSEDLLDAATYLKLLAQENKITTVSELKVYYEKRAANLVSRLDAVRERHRKFDLPILLNNYSGGEFILWKKDIRHSLLSQGSVRMDTAIRPDQEFNTFASSIRLLSFEDRKQDKLQLNDCLCWFSLHLFPENYLRQFSTHLNNEMVFLHDSGHHKLRYNKCIGDESLLSVTERSEYWEECEVYRKSFVDRLEELYAHLFEIIRLETPISEISVKKDLTQWIFSTKYLTACIHDYVYKDEKRCVNLSISGNSFSLLQGNNWSEYITDLFNGYYETKLQHKEWEILKSPPGSIWITSDNPGFVIQLDELNKPSAQPIADNLWHAIDNNASLYYPLSKDYCLRIQPGNNETIEFNRHRPIKFVQTDKEELNLVNKLTVLTHSQVVIAGDKQTLEQLQQT